MNIRLSLMLALALAFNICLLLKFGRIDTATYNITVDAPGSVAPVKEPVPSSESPVVPPPAVQPPLPPAPKVEPTPPEPPVVPAPELEPPEPEDPISVKFMIIDILGRKYIIFKTNTGSLFVIEHKEPETNTIKN